MAANIDPIFPDSAQMAWATLTTANTGIDGTGTVSTVFTAGADGSRWDSIKCTPLGTNVASLLRIFINNGSTAANAANNSLFHEITLAATTGSNSTASGKTEYTFAPDLVLPAGYKINVAIATTVASGWQITANGGNY